MTVLDVCRKDGRTKEKVVCTGDMGCDPKEPSLDEKTSSISESFMNRESRKHYRHKKRSKKSYY